MKIISKFKDYYDGMGGFCNQEPMFVREEKYFDYCHGDTEPASYKDVKEYLGSIPHFPSNDGQRFVLCFCGNVYPGYLIPDMVLLNTSCKDLFKGVYKAFFDLDIMLRDLRLPRLWIGIDKARDRKNDADEIEEKVKKKYYRYHGLTKKTWEEFKKLPVPKIPIERFIEFKTPYYMVVENKGGWKIVTSPPLKNLGFYHVMDGQTACMEIERYLGNEMVVQKDGTQNIDDKTMAGKKGFDKWSFRKHKDDPKFNGEIK